MKLLRSILQFSEVLPHKKFEKSDCCLNIKRIYFISTSRDIKERYTMYFESIKYFNRIKSAVLFIIVFALSGPAVMADGGADTKILKDITPVEAFDLIQENKENIDFIILDVRTEPEYKSGHIENAENIDYYSEGFEDELGELDKNKTYLIYCASGNRSGRTLKIMKRRGFQKAYNVLGGIKGWKSKGLPVVE